MKKKSNEGVPCFFCDATALPNTDPPLCEKHKNCLLEKRASRTPKTLKELESLDGRPADDIKE